jgi:hypothetical protein
MNATYNASDVKKLQPNYVIACRVFRIKIIFRWCINGLAYYNAGVVAGALTTAIYDASSVKNQYTTSSLVRFENKKYFLSQWKISNPTTYNASVVVLNFEIVGFAPGSHSF